MMPSSMVRPWIAMAVGGLGLAFAHADDVAAQTVSFPPLLELRVPKPPIVATAEDGSFLVYELHVTNFEEQPLTLERVEVLKGTSGDRSLAVLADSTLQAAIARPGADIALRERSTLPGGDRAVVYLWVPVESGAAPDSLHHRVTVGQGSADSVHTEGLVGAEVPVTTQDVVIGSPLRGGPWVTFNGPANDSRHRRALIPVNGIPAIAQRFAIDYVMLGDDGRTFSGNRLSNESYHAYGEEALAVASGVVVAVKDGIPENVPGRESRAVPITLETVGGNHVVIDLGDGTYAFYAHLQPGSLRVTQGERVTRGQVLGLVGNSGNSTEPHLHFHLSDGKLPLGSEGVPYVHDTFEIIGRCGALGCRPVEPTIHQGELPLADVIIRFPE